MQFSRWMTLEEALDRFPAGPGVFQVRVREGLLAFPKGRSAMVAYGAGADVRAALQEFLGSEVYRQAARLGPLWFRHAAPDAGRAPEEALAILRRRFIDQFGAPPYAEAG